MKTEEEVIDFEKSMGPWLGRTVKMADYHLQEAFADANLDITKEQMIILKKLHTEDGLPQNELALLTFRDKSSLARLLAKMEKKEYIIRIQSKRDKRINKVYLTDKGRILFKDTRPVIKRVLDVMERGITDEEKQRIINILQKIQINFEAQDASL
ncbi:MAG: MarR family transcriptional regulator [Eudoraea sp.]|nr:MarR family transcriptional regulator [Eudoraea sp.]